MCIAYLLYDLLQHKHDCFVIIVIIFISCSSSSSSSSIVLAVVVVLVVILCVINVVVNADFHLQSLALWAPLPA